VFRQALIQASAESIFMLQDSDDIPCSDRAEVLYRGLQEQNIDMIGCHELEVNEIDRNVRVYRFPLDVSAIVRDQDTSGVSDNAAEPFLHATAMIKRDRFQCAGGFSTNRRIANDSQFFLRASLMLRIANSDNFLYIRRVHRNALTVTPETHNGNRLRRELSLSWSRDFKRIKRGELRLEDSSLVAERSPFDIDVIPI
jgi:hypothetical protein